MRTTPVSGGLASQGHDPVLERSAFDSAEDRITTDEKAIDGPKIFILTFRLLYRVDTICCFTYTCSVVFRPFGLVVKGKSFLPGTET